MRLLIALLTLALAGCGAEMELTPYAHKFENGQIVYSRIDCRMGMIVEKHEFRNVVLVRFSATTERTNTSWLGADGDIERRPYAKVLMYEFELTESCE